MKLSHCLAIAIVGCLLASGALGADWPQFRYDARRGAACDDPLPGTLNLQWTRQLPPPRPAFPTEVRLAYDWTYEPVVMGKTMFAPSMVTDSVAALDTETGAERWRFFAEGPVRFAPAAGGGKVYFVSDDGYLYCVGAEDGKLRWRFRGLPEGRPDRKVLGNQRLVSLFPARGGPVLAGGKVYFAAGLWSGEGVFVHALSAETGKVVWSNVDSGRIPKANMDHGVSYYAGISPQGYLAIVDGKLVVPCGAQLPAILDLKTGRIGPYTMGWGGRNGLAKGAWLVAGAGRYLLHGGDLYDMRASNREKFQDPRGRKDFKPMLYLGGLLRLQIERTNQRALGDFRQPVLAEDTMYCDDDGVAAFDLSEVKTQARTKSTAPPYRKDDKYPDKIEGTFEQQWKLPLRTNVHIKAGGRLYCGRAGAVEAIDIPVAGGQPKVSWKGQIAGTPHRMLAADGKLFVVTREGAIHAFGGGNRKVVAAKRPAAPAPPKPDAWSTKAADILRATGAAEGFAVVLGIGQGRLADRIIRQSKCNVIAVDPDAAKVARFREAFHRAGLYGTRISIHVGDPLSYPLPPYLASLIVSEDPAALDAAPAKMLAKAVIHCLRPYGGAAWIEPAEARRSALVEEASAHEADGVVVRQSGGAVLLSRPAALPQTDDWSHRQANAANTGATRDRRLKAPLGMLWFDGAVRWNRKPGVTVVRVVGGRVVVKADKLRAIDVYTGRRLWERALPGTTRQAGEFAAAEDAVYLPGGESCFAFDAATGELKAPLKLPPGSAGSWAVVRVEGDVLVGAAGPHVLCMNRRSGELLWRFEAPLPVGDIAIGGGKVFCADRVNKRLPSAGAAKPQTRALDLKNGKPLWQAAGASTVRYSEPLEMLLTAGGAYRARDGKRMRDGATWPFTEEKLLVGKTGEVAAVDLRSGRNVGTQMQWFPRGCTSMRASSNLLTTRFMGNASYIDLATGEIASLWNIRAACSNNLFPANGVLNVPNLSGGCEYNYMPVSQAFVPAAALGAPVRSRK